MAIAPLSPIRPIDVVEAAQPARGSPAANLSARSVGILFASAPIVAEPEPAAPQSPAITEPAITGALDASPARVVSSPTPLAPAPAVITSATSADPSTPYGPQGTDLVAGRLGGGFLGYRPPADPLGALRAYTFTKEQVEAVGAIAPDAALPFGQAGQLPETEVERRRQNQVRTAENAIRATALNLLV